ncbi:MAG: hypothetical protein ACM30I_17740 [Gemmatimonas sp.]
MSRERTNLPVLPPAERHRRSRVALERRVIAEAMWSGHALATMALRPHMPRAITVEGWIGRDAAFRTRYERARADRRHVVGDELRAAANARYRNAAGPRQRIRALRIMLDVARWDLKTSPHPTDANDTSKKRKGLSEQMAALLVEILDKALAARGANDGASDDKMHGAPVGETAADTHAASADEASPVDGSAPPVGDEEASKLRERLKGPPPTVEMDADGDSDEQRVGDATPESPLQPERAPQPAAKPEPEPDVDRFGNRIHRDPPDTFYPRFDLDVPRPEHVSVEDYDPLKW